MFYTRPGDGPKSLGKVGIGNWLLDTMNGAMGHKVDTPST